MKSPPNFGEACGTTSFESGSVSASVTFVPACGPLTALAVELSLNSPRTVAILVHGFSDTTYTAGAPLGAVPVVPGAEALMRIWPW